MDEIESLKGRQGRVIFVGLSEGDSHLSIAASRLRQISPMVEIGLVLHWTEALNCAPLGSDSEVKHFENIFVAVDQLLSIEQVEAIRARWNPKWILIPKVGLDWEELLVRRIFTSRRGDLLLWAPPPDNPDGPFLSVDELEHHLRTLRLTHPLINLSAVPESWHIVSENGPIGPLIRPVYQVAQEAERTLTLSVIVPVQTFENGTSEAIQSLCDVLNHWQHTYEIVVCLDGVSWPIDLPKSPHIRLVEVPRTENTRSDWRPGYVRNCGAAISRCRNDGLLLFCDADVKITIDLLSALQSAELEPWDFAQLANDQTQLRWQSTTSKVFAVRRFAFDHVDGFPEAFSHYGCEDNALAWKLLHARYTAKALPPDAVLHLREVKDDDDGLLKMQRLSHSANLFYRLMISSDAHAIYWHFFSCLSERRSVMSTIPRAVLKRAYLQMPIRFAIKAAVFLLTLQQTDDRRKFIRGSFEAAVWSVRTQISKLARLRAATAFYIKSTIRTFVSRLSFQLRRLRYLISGNLWRIPWALREPGHRIKANLWRVTSFAVFLANSALFVGHYIFHFIKGNIWRIPWTLTEPSRIIKANLWFFKTPQGWIRKKWPWLYRTVVVRFERKSEGRQ